MCFSKEIQKNMQINILNCSILDQVTLSGLSQYHLRLTSKGCKPLQVRNVSLPIYALKVFTDLTTFSLTYSLTTTRQCTAICWTIPELDICTVLYWRILHWPLLYYSVLYCNVLAHTREIITAMMNAAYQEGSFGGMLLYCLMSRSAN